MAQRLISEIKSIRTQGKYGPLIQDIYKKTKCSVKSNDNLTQFFNLTKGVRQGCPLSPLLFNVYVNDIFSIIDSSTKCPVFINKGDNINALMYADDLVLISHSVEDLQTKLNKLTKYCEQWKLQINTKKTKCVVFNRGNKLCNANIFVNGEKIENVKIVKYLGFTISAKNCSFSPMLDDLSLKAKRAIFALNNKMKLSLIPVSLVLKIFYSQIAPILLYGAEV